VGHEADHSHLSAARINEWSYTATSYIRLHNVCREYFFISTSSLKSLSIFISTMPDFIFLACALNGDAKPIVYSGFSHGKSTLARKLCRPQCQSGTVAKDCP